MSTTKGFTLGLITGTLLTSGVIGVAAIAMQPIKQRPQRQPIALEAAPKAVQDYIKKDAPGVKGFTGEVITTGDVQVFSFESETAPQQVRLSLTQSGALLNWGLHDNEAGNAVPAEVRAHFAQAMPGAKVFDYGLYNTLGNIYTAWIEKDGKGYTLSLSSSNGLEIEEMQEWVHDVHKDREVERAAKAQPQGK